MDQELPANDGSASEPAFASLRGQIGRLLAGRGWTRCFATPAGLVVAQDGRVVPPPIRFTPRELDALATDYFLHQSVLRTGDLVIDVGCGMGTELLSYIDRIGRSGLVLGFEAHPRSFQIALALQHLNNIRNVRLFPLAVWSEATVLDISDDPDSLGINSVVDRRLLSGGSIPVAAVSLDAFLAENFPDREVGLLKMNIEGAEIHALQGAVRTLERTRSCVIACHDFVVDEEGGDPALRTLAQVQTLLSEAGFRLSRRTDHPLSAIRHTVYAQR